MLVNSRANGRVMEKESDPQVVPKAERWKFSAEYKERILAEVDACTERGQIGALLRREGLYSSHLEKWRTQRERGELGGRKRGRKSDPQSAETARLQRENEQLRARLAQAEEIIQVQKKLAQLLGKTLDDAPKNNE